MALTIDTSDVVDIAIVDIQVFGTIKQTARDVYLLGVHRIDKIVVHCT